MSDSFKNDPAFTMPWSVKGVSAEARAKAKQAANTSGKTIGSWLSQAIRIAANDPELFAKLTDLTEKKQAAPAATVVSPDSAVLAYLQKMDEKLNHLSERIQAVEQDDAALPDYDPVAFTAGKNWPAQ